MSFKSWPKGIFRLLVPFAALLWLAACGGGSSGSGSPPPSGQSPPPVLTITDRSPAAVAIDVPTGSSLVVTFSETLDCNTVTTSALRINNVNGSIQCSGNTASFVPTSPLANSSAYTASVTNSSGAIRSLAGSTLDADSTWAFITQAASAPPTTLTITSRSPAANATGVLTSASLAVSFSTTLDCSTVTVNALKIVGVVGSVQCSGSTASFVPSSPLNYSTSYTATVTNSSGVIRSTAGSVLDADSTWTFTTQAAPPPPALTITSRSPAANTTGVLTSATLTVTFSEALDCNTITTSAFKIVGVAGSVQCSGSTASFVPSSPLNYSTSYTATVTNSSGTIRSSQGGALEADNSWTFTTEAPPALTITSRSPAANATGVATGSWLTVTFSEELDCSTVTTSALRIVGVGGTIQCGGNIASFLPSASLAANTTYTASVTNSSGAILSRAGAVLDTGSSWTFTTGGTVLQLDTRVPTADGTATLFRYPYLQTDGPRKMKILWATTTSGGAELRYRLASASTWTVVPATETSYPSGLTGISSFYQQEAVLTGLNPATDYVYSVDHNGVTLASDVPFRTLPESTTGTVNFVAFGDSGTQYSQPRTVRDAITATDGAGNLLYPHDFVVGLGDIAYTNGTFAEFNTNFFQQMSGRGDLGNGSHSLLTRRAFFPVLGNHEHAQTSTGAGTEASAYVASFSLPLAAGAPAADAEFYYSFDTGSAHFAVIDSMKFEGDTTATRLSSMLSWLDADLAASTKTWKIVFLHHAVFSNGAHGTYGDIQQNNRMRKQLLPILQDRGVQLVMYGHDHFYQRSLRLRVDANGKIVRNASCKVEESSNGIVYVLTGIGGSDILSSSADPRAGCGTTNYNYYVANYGDGYDFVASRNNELMLLDLVTGTSNYAPSVSSNRYGFAYVTITPSTLTLTAYNTSGDILDHFSIAP